MGIATATLGDVVIGGAHGYAELITALGAHQQHIALYDDAGNLMKVWGACRTPNGDAFFALGQRASYEDYTPHDICYIPGTNNPYEFAVLIGRTDDTVELWRYAFNTATINMDVLNTYTGLTPDAGWTHEVPMKLAIACDGRTVYWTDQGASIFIFDLALEIELTPFDVIDPGDPLENYLFGGIDILPNGDIFRAITPIVAGGIGPRRDVSIGSDTEIWTDQVNESPIKVYKRLSDDFDTIVVSHTVSLNTAAINSEVLSLAAWYYACFQPRRRINVNVSG